jgi:hypothetical protein
MVAPRGFLVFPLPLTQYRNVVCRPVLHGALRLRDRKTLILGLLYAGGAAAFLLLANYVPEADLQPGWLGNVLTSLTFLLLLWLVFGALVDLGRLRRRVYLKIPAALVDDDDVLRTSEAENATERKFRALSDLAGVFVGLFFALFICVAIPAGAIAQTLSGRDNIFVGGDAVQSVVLVIAAFVAIFGLIGWLAVGYNPDDRLSVHSAFLAAALVVNIYLGFAVWLIATKVIGIEPAASHSRFGAMVWWNLTDSIPFVDVDSALDWEAPMDEFGAGIGWLLLLQRVVLLLTLARIIQVLVNRWTNFSSATRASRPKHD